MRTADAIRMINHLAFRPGWRFQAMPGYHAGTIDVDCTIDTVDTNREYAPYYRQRKILGDYYEIKDVEQLDADDILFELLRQIEETHQHEDREFLRRGDRDWEAPFHPHRGEGKLAWRAAEDHARERVSA